MSIFKWGSFALVCLICFYAFISKKTSDKAEALQQFAEKHSMLILAAIMIAGAAVRFADITELPAGLHIDEWAIAYDAWANMNFGVDRHLKHNPVYLINFGGGQNVLLFYMIMLSYKLFGGVSVFAIRFPTAVMGVVAIFAIYKIAQLADRKITGIVAAFFTAVMPVFINMSRFGLESYLLYSMLSLSVMLFMLAVNKEETHLFVLAGISFGLTLYTYAVSYIIIPVFLLISLGYLFWCRKIRIRQIVFMALPLGLLALPLMAMLAVNTFDLPEISTAMFTITKLPEYRGGEVSLANIKNIAEAVKTVLIMDWLPYNSDGVFNTMYIATIPLIVLGVFALAKKIVVSVKNKEYDASVMAFAGVIAAGVALCLISYVNVNKANGIYPFLVVFAAAATVLIFKKSYIQFMIVIAIYIANFSLFCCDYFQPVKYDEIKTLFAPGVNEVFEKAEDGMQVYICDLSALDRSVQYALAAEISPYEVNKIINGDSSSVFWHNQLPVYRNENGELEGDFDFKSVYALNRFDLSEQYCFAREELEKLGFEKEKTGFYDIYFIN